ncbi:MAG: glycosyltransferase [Planctomycetaceae bacterium]
MKPLVSILLPTFNQRDYVAATIESCLSQTWPAIEILIGDDASKDGTWEIIAGYAKAEGDRVKAVRNPANVGVSRNCNRLLARVTGKYVALFAGDDLMYPEKLTRQIEYLEAHPDVAICAHDMHIIGNDNVTPLSKWSDSAPTYSGGVELFFEHLCFACGCSLVVRRDCIPDGGYLEFLVASDWLFFVEVMLRNNGRIHTINEVLGAYRRHPGQLTVKGPESLANTLDHAFACGYMQKKYPARSEEIGACLNRWKRSMVQELRNQAVWGQEISQAQLASPRWLFRAALKAAYRRIWGRS